MLLPAVLGLACAKAPLRAALDDAAGLEAGSAVYAAGVNVGTVREVRVEGERAVVSFELRAGHALSLRADACAMSLPTEGSALLLVFPGKDLAPLPAALPACEAHEQRVATLKKLALSGTGALNLAVRRFLEQLEQRPSASPAAGPCEALSVSRLRIEPVHAVPVLLPRGGHRLWLSLENRSPSPVALETTTFMDARGSVAAQARLPESDELLMSLAIPAHTRREVSAVFEGTRANQVSAVELEAAWVDAPAADSCRVRWRL
jgi:hypothetical protein